MSKPDRQPDFRSSSKEFWFEPEMVSLAYHHELNVKLYKLEINNNLLCVCDDSCSEPIVKILWPTLQDAYKANLKRLHNEVDKILLGVDDV